MSYFILNAKQVDKIHEKIRKFAEGHEAEQIINGYLQNEGGDLIAQEIKSILPISGRKWKGKTAAASETMPFRKKREQNLSVTVHTTKRYHYLYFPDDGADTIRHRGDQQFMFEGAGRKAEEIGDTILEKLIERLEE